MSNLNKVFLGIAVVCALGIAVMLIMGNGGDVGMLVVLMFSTLALFTMGNNVLKGYAFSVWVLASVAASMYYPNSFGSWFGYDLKILIVPLIQIIMFGMGTTLNLKDFGRVMKVPWPIFIGMALQFGIKPVIALGTAMMFGFKGDIAAGVILIGSVPGGVASNLMTYLASGDVALSVTMTSFSTIVSPVMTPFVMQKLGGRFVTIEFLQMMFSILNMIIVPIIAGLIANKILYSKAKWAGSAQKISLIAAAGLAVALISIYVPGLFQGRFEVIRPGIIIGSILIAAVSISKLVISIFLNGPENWMDRVLPLVSMAGIVFIIAIITSRSKEDLATVGAALIVCTIIQMSAGYLLGYWISKAVGLNEKTCRTVSIEVGLQNGGMATGLAINVLKSTQAALASAVYGPMMNVTGSILATYWHRKPLKDEVKE
ncbi:bile acid:sodium symporter family protein [Candidatus Latescibacterota bacterium]